MIEAVKPETVHVLVVEDDEIDVEVVRRKFKKQNMTNPLFHAFCGVDALAILRGENEDQKISQPCILLVDINMPRMNGLEFLAEVRRDEKLKKNVAFILTTSARGADIDAAYELNVAGYFLKDDLDKLTEMLRYYREINKFSGK
ncbi:MAG TPA: two-component system response regulator [Nitrospiraceae bacterium]|nr:two-component system response regulator [Nitrospiraceae bacterium]